jgi:tRNA 2-thiouridine synthesizing protein C
MGIAVFEMDISVVFLDDGVYALVKDQNPDKLDMKPLGDGFPMLSEFGVHRFYVHAESLSERGLTTDDLVMDVEVVDSAQVAQILSTAGKVLPF